MKKNINYILSCFLLLVSCFSNAQETKKNDSNRTIDSLLNVLKILSSPSPEVKLVKGTDTAQINALNELSWQYRNIGNYEKAFLYGQEAQHQAEKLNYKKGLINVYFNFGYIYENQNNYEKALNNYLKSLKISEEILNKSGMINAYNSIGTIYTDLGNYARAVENIMKSLK